MKILYHHRVLSKDGQFVHIEELVNALRGLGHEIALVGPAAIKAREFGADSQKSSSIRKALPPTLYEILEILYNGVAFLRLLLAWARYRPEAIYERYNLFLFAGVWLKKLSGLPLLLEVNAPLFEERRKYGGLALQGLARWLEAYVWRSADTVITVTQALADQIEQAGVPPSRIVVMPNGIDVNHFLKAPASEEAKARLNIAGKFVLGFVGFVRDWHRLDQVIDYLADSPSRDELRLLVVGDGPAIPDLKRRAEERDVAHLVIWTGIIARDSVPDYIAAFDVALQPAVTPYASPLKMIEYMAMGRAIVAPALRNILELLSHGKNALLFDPADPSSMIAAIDQLHCDAKLRQALGEAARRTIDEKKLTWRHNAERSVQLFMDGLKRRGRTVAA